VRLAGAKPVAWYADGPAAGGPAVTRHELGDGQAWYVSAGTDAATTAALLAAACAAAGITAPASPAASPGVGGAAPVTWPRDLEIVRRRGGRGRFVTLINHGKDDASVELGGRTVTVAAGDALVIRGG
jgi:beta-galactosidase